MRKLVLMTVLVLTLALAGVSVIRAQDRLPIEFGQWVEGSITSDAVDVRYTFKGTKGQLILVEMMPKPGTYDLDPEIVLRDSDGDILGQNDDFSYPLSVVVAELQSDEDYVVLATRSGGKEGTSEGAYWLRVTPVEPLKAGTKTEVTLTSEYDKQIPHVFVLRQAENGPVKLGFSQPIGDLFASFELSEWEDDSYPTSVLQLDSTGRISSAAMTLELEGGKTYVLIVSESSYSYAYEPIETVVTFSVN